MSTVSLLYLLALTCALFKDTIDLIGAIPVFYPFVMVVSLLVGVAIFSLVFLANSVSGQKKRTFAGAQRHIQQSVLRYAALFGTTVAETFLYGLSLIPLQTLTVIFLWVSTMRDMRRTDQEHAAQHTQGDT